MTKKPSSRANAGHGRLDSASRSTTAQREKRPWRRPAIRTLKLAEGTETGTYRRPAEIHAYQMPES